MADWTEREMERVFEARFSSLGRSLLPRTEWQRGIHWLAKAMTGILGLDATSVYCDVILVDSVNAFVTKEDDLYLIGITDGIVSGVFNQIRSALDALQMDVNGEPGPLRDAPIQELQYILNLYALAFVIGHECGHIELGHLDRNLFHAELAGANGRASTYLEEAQADLMGAMAMVAFKKDLHRLRELTNRELAVGLMQLPVAVVMSTFRDATAPVVVGHGYPHPTVRLMRIGRFLIDFMGYFVSNGAGLDTEERRGAETLLSPILLAVSPSMLSFIHNTPQQIGDAVRELIEATRPVHERWYKQGTWLVFDTPEYEAMLESRME